MPDMNQKRPSGGLAYGGLLLFILILYANPGNWFDSLAQIPFAKIAAAASLIALVGAWLLNRRSLTVGGSSGAMLLGLFFLTGMSASWSYWPRYTFDTFLDGLKYLAIFFVLVNTVDSPKRLSRFCGTVVLATLIPAIATIISWMRGEHLVDGDRAAWIGVFGNPNDLAYHLVIGTAILFAQRVLARRWRVAYLLALIPIGLALLLTQSRGGLLGFAAVAGLWALGGLRRTRWAAVPVRAGGLVLALGCALMLSPKNLWTQRMDRGRYFGEDVSTRGRVDAWRTGMNILADRPLTGVGAGAFVVAWPEFAPGDAGAARTTHNTFIQLTSELGVGALLLLGLAIFLALRTLARAFADPTLEPYARGVQCGLAGFAVCSMSGGLAFSWPLYILLGLAVSIGNIARCAESTAS